MRLAAPLTAPGEAALLFADGATEFYCGLQDDAWQARFGNHDSISRRQGAANLPSMAVLAEVLAETRALAAPLFLALNGSYSEAQLPLVLQLAHWFEQQGGTGLMVADTGLLVQLQQQGSGLVRGVSVLAGVGSAAALAVYQELGAARVVLPRHLAPGQMAEVLAPCPGMEAEALVFLDKCPFIDGLCRFVHSVGYQDAPPDAEPPQDAPALAAWDLSYRLPACFALCGRPPASPTCAACSLSALLAAGVTVFKMGGRGRSLEVRRQGVQFLAQAARLASDAARQRLYHQTFGAVCSPAVCYYNA